MSARYYAKLYDYRRTSYQAEALNDATAEVRRKEAWLTAMLECLGEVAVDIPCYGDSFPEEEWCSACRARHLGRKPFVGVEKCRRALATRMDPPSPRRPATLG